MLPLSKCPRVGCLKGTVQRHLISIVAKPSSRGGSLEMNGAVFVCHNPGGEATNVARHPAMYGLIIKQHNLVLIYLHFTHIKKKILPPQVFIYF